uniref:Uncharacterized protein n=1 Tax=Tetranychus urticae TaxID=32264 RepID=T1K7N9_TETUR
METTALLFSSLGAKVAIVGRDQSKLDKVAAGCEAKSPHRYKPVVIKADFVADEDVVGTFEETISAHKKFWLTPDCEFTHWVYGVSKAALDMFTKSMAVNPGGVHTHPLEPSMLEKFISMKPLKRIAEPIEIANFIAFLASDASRNMTVNPGGVHTHPIEPSLMEKFKAMKPLNRIAEPIDIANLIAFLASDVSRNMTGSIVVSDSGFLCADPYKVLSGK